MGTTTAALLLFVSLPLLTYGQFHDGFTHNIMMGTNNMYSLFWKSGTKATDSIEFEAQVRTKGWIGLGFSPNGGMAGADIVIVWMDANGRPQISDRHGPAQGNGFPQEDAVQNYEIVSGRENATHTIIRFKRKLSTCDANDWQINADTTRLIWAYSNEKPTSRSQFKMHTGDTRGTRSAFLLHPQTKDRAQEIFRQPGVKTADFVAKNVLLPHTSQTLYWCQIFKAPKYNKKSHVIGYDVIMQPGNEKHMHHVQLFGCPKNLSRLVNTGQDCTWNNSTDGLDFWKECSDNELLSSWFLGGEAFAYPDNMAAPWYGEQFDYMMGVFHYDNEELKRNVRDNSRFRIYVTENLRPIETGRFNFGAPQAAHRMMIPPKQESFKIYAYCPAQCTMNLQDQPLTIFAGVLHAHLTGVKMRLRQIRNGVELPYILIDNHYDPNYQTTVAISPDKQPKILPGDDIILECEYNTKGRNVTTFGGPGAAEEMCLTFLEYYPKRERFSEGCVSGLTSERVSKLLGARNLMIGGEADNADKTMVINAKGQNQTWRNFVNGNDWGANDAKRQYGLVKDLEKIGRDEPHIVDCGIQPKNKNDPKVAKNSIQLLKNPTISTPYDSSDPACKSSNLMAAPRGG